MIEIKHRNPEPVQLSDFVAAKGTLIVDDFGSLEFQAVKLAVKACLNEDQGGLCAYCETKIGPRDGQVDHIKPKGGRNAHPHLCFSYTNYAHSCINAKRCGQKKGEGILPIEPADGCNDHWQLSTDGTIEARLALTKAQKHAVRQTLGMLGLNSDAGLVDERRRRFRDAVTILRDFPADIDAYLADGPFRQIIGVSF